MAPFAGELMMTEGGIARGGGGGGGGGGPVLLQFVTRLYTLTVPMPVAKSQPVVARYAGA